jgi:hypothetical protein
MVVPQCVGGHAAAAAPRPASLLQLHPSWWRAGVLRVVWIIIVLLTMSRNGHGEISCMHWTGWYHHLCRDL